MNEHGEEEALDPLRQELRAAMAGAVMTPAKLREKLLLWGVRQLLLTGCAYFWWEHAWMHWVFWIGCALALVNLVLLLVMPRIIAARIRRAQDHLDRAQQRLNADETSG